MDRAAEPQGIRVVLADDHAVVRHGLRAVLEVHGGIEVVGEAADADAAVTLAAAERPAVAVLDLQMPGTPTLDAIPALLAAAPGTAVLVLTMQDAPAYVQFALEAGARGYVLKDAPEDELVRAVRAVAGGGRYVQPALAAGLVAGALGPGDAVAGHRIEAKLAEGGMGVVYRARDLALDRPVALKVIAASVARDPGFRERFMRECRAAAALDHPNVVPVYRAGEDHTRLFLTMRLIEGTDLRALLAAEGRLDADRAVAITSQVAAALDAAHARGLVHRDVKPANVLLEGGRAFLTDFGVTRDAGLGSDLTRTGEALGTVDYMAPEQAAGAPVDGRADVYALACVLFRSLTGGVVFDRPSALDRLWAHRHEPPPDPRALRPDLPAGLADALRRGLAKDPQDRPATAGALAAQARAGLAG